jgi:RimJ/RimL family protein N-acetyltransferase
VNSPDTIRIPKLSTSRLLLRGFVAEDFEAYAAMMAVPAVTRYLGDGQPLARTAAWFQMAMFAGHWVLHGFGVWAVEERETGRFIGRIGCHQPEGFPVFELAYTLAPEAWGRGYAREGAAAALRHAREELGRTAIASIIRPANAASIRVAQSLGAEAAETVEFFGAPAVLYRYPSA